MNSPSTSDQSTLFALPYPISTNRMWRNFRGRMVMSKEGKDYKEYAAWLAKQKKLIPISGEIELIIILHPKKTKNGLASKTRLDLDNALKCAIDSLNGVAYHDDKKIVRIRAEIGMALSGGALVVAVKRKEQSA